ncbi:methyltransferase family protein [Parapedobacter deserti]|uniref:Methyltransferase family protein n=1 Tax=Parapedobacter deserti TaxID=1912957 RepID=A0ABV7JE49_9SPHI
MIMHWFTPPYLLLTTVILTIIGSYFSPNFPIGNKVLFKSLGIAICLLGAVLVFSATKQITKNETEILTFKEPQNLITDGVFEWSRNPIYLGFLLIVIGVTLLCNNWICFIFPLVFFLICNLWYIPYEENELKRKFDKEYRDYQHKTRRWI